GESLSVVMELVKSGDLGKWLRGHKKKDLNDPYHTVYRQFVEEIAEGMAHLSSKGIIHRDLAARNILITEKKHIKITDFGLAKRLEDKNYYRIKSPTDLPVFWTAPECYSPGYKVTLESDVWSFGVVMWEIYSEGRSPYLTPKRENVEHLKAVCSGERLQKSSDWPDFIQTLMDKCWQIDAKDRPSFVDIVKELKETAV
ncbi:hypothetical protein LOTGIDRAFT_128734, partial [Lottia gigantea]